MEENKMVPAVPTVPEEKKTTLTKEQLQKLKDEGIELTPEEVKQLEALASTSATLSSDDLSKVAGGVNPKVKKALLIILASGAGVGGLGYAAYANKDKITNGFNSLKDKLSKKS